MSIFVTQSSMASLEEYLEEIKPIFESKRMTNMGPVYKKLQAQLKEYLDVKELSLFVNGHLALENGLQTFDFPVGSEVITTPYTFVSTTHAIVRQNLVPVFCDIDPADYTIDVSKIEELITEKTVAIMPVHVYGNLCDVETIQEIADRHGLKVLYDGAHAFGVKYKGIGVGNFGDMCMYSFHATKVFNTVEGGAIAFKDKCYQMRLHELKNFGIHGEDCVADVGGNAKLDEFRAAMGICNLRYVDENIKKREAVAKKYDAMLGDVPGIRLMQLRDGVTPNYAYYPVYIDPKKSGETRDDVYQRLEESDIYARRYFYPATNDLECYKGKFEIQETPVAHDVSMNILCLPMYADLELNELERICGVIVRK
ncbi:MAG: DegT/DnrJ/EryC1/StrS family aminotransferase [Clostridiales bacterium]|nr:DegT/DnrJ/EryC1/StrS family aminotransferase [Clostridiales bacterium]